MLRRRLEWSVVGGLSVVLLVAACGDDTDPGQDAGVDARADAIQTRDSGPDVGRDRGADAPALPANIGEGCSRNKDCQPGSPLCLLIDSTTQTGVCSRECVPDDPQTQLLNEDDCGEGFLCGEFRLGAETLNYCLTRCTPSLTANPCPSSSKTTCHPVSTRFAALDQAACWYLACKDDKQCPVLSATPCTTDTDCTSLAVDAFCDPDEDRCARPGNCTAGGLCGPHAYAGSGNVGDPCTSDFDCSASGFCLVEDASVPFGPAFRNGYCSVRSCSFAAAMPEFACPVDSTCHRLFYGGLCFKSCSLTDPATCRGVAADKGGDYECYAWNRLAFSDGSAVSDTPVCQSASQQQCDGFPASLDCSSIGLENNPTSMLCRDRDTGAPLPAGSTQGVCLDDTASGAFVGLPPADGGTVDAASDASGAADAAPAEAGTPDAGTADVGAADATTD